MRVLSEEEIAEEIRFMEDYAYWPLWPLLPVKNINRGDPEYDGVDVAVMVTGDLKTVWFKNLYEFTSDTSVGDQLKDCDHQTFESTEDLVRAGWVGD